MRMEAERYYDYPEKQGVDSWWERLMYRTVARNYLRREELHYRNGWVLSPDAKLLFLVGTEEVDITKAETCTGITIYTKKANHVKAPEIFEAASAISDHFERERNVPNVLSELADVWYNLIQLTQLDPDFSVTYKKCVDQLREAVGYSTRDAFLLIHAKYQLRFYDNKGVKEHNEEIEAIKFLLKGENIDPIATPSDEELNKAYRLLNKMSVTILKPRLLQFQTLQTWKRASWYPDSDQWEHRIGDPDYPGMRMNKSTVNLLGAFKDTLHPKANIVVQPVTDSRGDADMSLSSIFPNVRYVTRSRQLAYTLANIGFMTYHQNPIRFKPEEKIDILFLNQDKNVLLSSVADGGYVIQALDNSAIRRKDYIPVGVLTHKRYTGDVYFDDSNPADYKLPVSTDSEFQQVSAIYERDQAEWHPEPNEETDPPYWITADGCITYDQAAEIVRKVTGATTDIVAHYQQILKQRAEEEKTGKAPLNQKVDQYDMGTALPYKRYGLGETYIIFQRAKSGTK